LGPEPDQIDLLKRRIARPHGLVLSAGPVGCGKSTTMYSCLELLCDPTKSVVTIEDPIERRIPGALQIQIEPKIGFGFVEALRGVLRQDADIMMVGEIRDPETAQIAARAARSGILVLSTLHANDASAAFDVFRDFGVPAMFIADAIQAVVAQRLLRRVCPRCRVTVPADDVARAMLSAEIPVPDNLQLARGTGCEGCFRSGYSGRTGIFEIIAVDEEIRQAILTGASRAQIEALARAKGMGSLGAAAARKVVAGETTIEEVNRVLLAEPIGK